MIHYMSWSWFRRGFDCELLIFSYSEQFNYYGWTAIHSSGILTLPNNATAQFYEIEINTGKKFFSRSFCCLDEFAASSSDIFLKISGENVKRESEKRCKLKAVQLFCTCWSSFLPSVFSTFLVTGLCILLVFLKPGFIETAALNAATEKRSQVIECHTILNIKFISLAFLYLESPRMSQNNSKQIQK